jgi:DNA-binding transcriptional regulator YiaG
MGKVYESDLLGVIHEMAEDLHQIGAISDARMRECDKNCLVREPEPVKEAVETAEMEHTSPVTAGI